MAQNFGDFEILISDDSSPDDSTSVIPPLLEKSGRSFRYYLQSSNLGYDGNVRFCLAAARGRYIFLLGNDDILTDTTTLEHARLNHLTSRVELIQAVVGTENGQIAFESNGTQSHAVARASENSTLVESVSLDQVFAGKKLDILKIDVEGYEENVLKGATALLQDPQRRPRAIYIEVHPQDWPETGASSDSLLEILGSHGYQAFFVDGRPVEKIDEYGGIIARRAVDAKYPILWPDSLEFTC